MKTSIYKIIIVLSIILLSGCDSSDSETPKKITFNSILHDDPNWSHGFADYSDIECETDNCNKTAEYRDLPQGFNDAQGYFMESNNHSDDMLMALWRKIDGLVPNTTYQVDINTTLATPHCAGMMGIGGSPDSSNYVRAGMIGFMPTITKIDGRYTINLDKGNQAQEGVNAIIIGDLGVECNDYETYSDGVFPTTLKTTSSFSFTSDNTGSGWLFIANDSGFEGITQFYLIEASVTLTP